MLGRNVATVEALYRRGPRPAVRAEQERVQAMLRPALVDFHHLIEGRYPG